VTRDEVRRYLLETRDVEGWFFPVDAYLFGLIDEIQRGEGIAGHLFEIGVHHGKTALFLARMAREGERVGVCDVFEQQELNRDRSGEGSRELFLRNMRALAGLDDAHLRVFARESSTLTPEDTTTRCRFFHIDGGHRPEDVMNDLAVAERALLPDGVVALDDLFNPNWPGVGEGFYRFIAAQPDVFVPILIGGNKVLFTRPNAVGRYEGHWDEVAAAVDAPFTFDYKEWLGHRVLTAIRGAWVDLDPMGAARAHLLDNPLP
jgi:SAM-dependent methyltransferase